MSRAGELARQAATLNEVEWYDFLDEIDDVARKRRQNPPPEPDGADRDAVAAYVANLHFIGDNKIREIWYLPANAESGEIRLLEINERVGEAFTPQPQTFGEEIGGHCYKLRILDMTGGEFESARSDARQLPAGWTLDSAIAWRRGA